ncbi:response regulator [Undibacterium sp. Ren11W]|uniref:response regulator n=1 Tax=Undibacterium sp. Ren11W TaxID=3413045 RepID=UPI003BF14A53
MNATAQHQNIALKVMIIDDDEFQIEFVSELLSELGISQIISASGGKSGLDIFDKTQKKPDLLICDIQMPDIDGFEFMRALGERNYQGGVVLMSGQGAKVLYTASLVAQLSRQNFLGTIEKPMQKSALEKVISQLLNS